MHHTTESARSFMATSREALRLVRDVESIICPPYPLIPTVRSETLGTPIKLGAQNLASEEEGAFTGEVSAVQLEGLVDYVIIGHSERRRFFGETNGVIGQKLVLALKHHLKPILCFEKVEDLKIVGENRDLIVAYEPVFAIGSGHPDTPENAAAVAKQAQEVVGFAVPVLYGGSVTPSNVRSFLEKKEISGALVGGASLDPVSFVNLVHASSGF